MPLKAGKQDDFPESMAEDMLIAFKNAWKEYKRECPPNISEEYLQPLFIAVAQGVVKHLNQHADAFYMKVVQTNEPIQCKGKTGKQKYLSPGNHYHKISTVTQKSDRVECDNRDRLSGEILDSNDIVTTGILFNTDVLSATLNSTNVTYFGGSDGTITISSPTGGSGTYEYTINGGGTWQVSGNFTALAAATYDVQIRDAATPSCVVILDNELVITEPAGP